MNTCKNCIVPSRFGIKLNFVELNQPFESEVKLFISKAQKKKKNCE